MAPGGPAHEEVSVNLVDLLLRPASDAFLNVGVWVGLLVAAFGLLEWRTSGRVEPWLERHRRLGPLAGALLGVTPGCGGAVLVMPMFGRGTVSFGTVVAALVATMGDSSFVIIAANPRTALILHALLLVVGVVCGLLVDRLGVAPAPGPVRSRSAPLPVAARSTVGAAAAEIGMTGRIVVRFPSPGLVAFWSLVIAGLGVSAARLFDPAAAAGIGGGVGPGTYLGVVGAAMTGTVFVRGRGRVPEPREPLRTGDRDALRSVLHHAARETAFVTVWVAASFCVLAWLGALGVAAPEHLPAAGLAGIVAAALVGLLPGCGPQIVLTGLYAAGALPFSMLAANALSQDGDALLPLIATHRRAALFASALTTVPGLIVGAALLAIGW